MRRHDKYKRAFTLIEMSIVLVIIGLLVGGILVGQDLIRAAYARAQVTQIEKYNTAANTFRDKYGGLPGDISPTIASQFGFLSRAGTLGAGNSDGLLQCPTGGIGNMPTSGENALFWTDLSTAGLIAGGFSTTGNPNVSPAQLATYLPQSSLGNGNYVYVFSGGVLSGGVWYASAANYFGISAITSIVNPGFITTNQNIIPVNQAYSIDAKVDDGFPQTGRVTAQYGGGGGPSPQYVGASGTSATPGSATTCYDNGSSSANAPQQYSLEINNGSYPNCALTFRFQ